MKKKLIIIVILIFILGNISYGNNTYIIGDKVDETVYTDIITYINNIPIKSYNIKGYTAVVAEDLRNYGFDIYWDNSIRALSVHRSGSTIKSTSDFEKTPDSLIGKKAYDILYSDIKTYVNDEIVESYNIDGQTILYVNDLAKFGNLNWMPDNRELKLTLNSFDPMKSLADNVYFLADEQIQSDENYYNFIFALKNERNERIKSPASVNIKIINNNGEIVYDKLSIITPINFSIWSNKFYGWEKLLGAMKIQKSDILNGSISEGKIKYTIFYENSFNFEEQSLDIDDLPYTSPVSKSSLKIEKLPKVVSDYSSYSNTKRHSIKITGIDYEFKESYDGKMDLYLYFSGEKTYDYDSNTTSTSDISWKLYEDGFVIKSGSTYTPSLSVGEKFRNKDDKIYNLEPGQYSLELFSTY